MFSKTFSGSLVACRCSNRLHLEAAGQVADIHRRRMSEPAVNKSNLSMIASPQPKTANNLRNGQSSSGLPTFLPHINLARSEFESKQSRHMAAYRCKTRT